MHKWIIFRQILGLILLILLLPLAAYGDVSKPIRIGATVSQSGRFSEPSAMVRDGYRLWEKQVNQRGGLMGRPVELVVYDDRSDPETAHHLYQQLIHQDRVDLVLSAYGTPLTLQASQVSEARQMVMLACAASGKAIWNRGYGHVFGMYALADRYFIGMLELMQAAGWRPKAMGITIAPIHPDFFRNAGPIAEGIFGPSQWEPDERIPFPGTTKFIGDFQAACNKLPSYHAGSAYAGCQILERAITDLQEINHTRIRDYISSLDTVTVIGRFKVDHQGRQVGHNPILVQWQNGRKEIVYPTKMQTARPRFYPHPEPVP